MWPNKKKIKKTDCLGLSIGDQLIKDYFRCIVSVNILHTHNYMDMHNIKSNLFYKIHPKKCFQSHIYITRLTSV